MRAFNRKAAFLAGFSRDGAGVDDDQFRLSGSGDQPGAGGGEDLADTLDFGLVEAAAEKVQMQC